MTGLSNIKNIYLWFMIVHGGVWRRGPHTRGMIPLNDVSILAPGTLVYCRSHPLGRNKIQDAWAPSVFEVVECKDGLGNVYEVRRQDGVGPSKCLHRSELKPVPTSHVIRAPVVEGGVENSEVEEEIEVEEDDGLVVEVTVAHPSAVGQRRTGQMERGRQLHPYPCSGGQVECVGKRGEQNLSTSGESLGPSEDTGCGGLSTVADGGHGRVNTLPPPVRRTTRPTAGCHSNPFRLPQGLGSSDAVVNSHFSVFRPWQ